MQKCLLNPIFSTETPKLTDLTISGYTNSFLYLEVRVHTSQLLDDGLTRRIGRVCDGHCG